MVKPVLVAAATIDPIADNPTPQSLFNCSVSMTIGVDGVYVIHIGGDGQTTGGVNKKQCNVSINAEEPCMHVVEHVSDNEKRVRFIDETGTEIIPGFTSICIYRIDTLVNV